MVLMARYGTPYRECIELQKALKINALDEKTEARDRVSCVKAWAELEYLKRELRGIPRLASSSLKEIMDAKRELQKSVNGPAGDEPVCRELPPDAASDSEESVIWE